MYYTYVLESTKDKKRYIGWTNNLKERYRKHNKGLVKSTRDRAPFKLVYYEACNNKEKAIEREKYFKTGFERRFLNGRL